MIKLWAIKPVSGCFRRNGVLRYVAQHSVVEMCNRNANQSVKTKLCSPYAVQDVQSTLLNTPLLRCASATHTSPSGRNCVIPYAVQDVQTQRKPVRQDATV